MKVVLFDGTLMLIITLCALGVLYLLYTMIFGKKKPLSGNIGQLEEEVEEALDIKEGADRIISETKEKATTLRQKLEKIEEKIK